MTEKISGGAFKQMVAFGAACITAQKQAINDLNVFPVPDGDTGTNMSMTINAAASDLRKTEDPDLEKASKVAASAMLRGARGNSGVILSLLFRGISKRLKGSEECDGVLWAQALQEGVDAAYKAVMKPAEGTILFIEDVGERPHAVERMMYNLKLGGVLDKLSGLIIGQFTEYEENKSLGKDLYGALADLVKEYDYPICFDFPVGHVSMNVPLINGAAVTLKVGKKEVKLSFNTERE